MSAVLVDMEDLKAYIDSEIEKGIEKGIEEKLPAVVEKVLSNPENPIFIKAIESILAISDFKILKRLYTHDVMLGLEEPYEEEEYVSIPAQIQELKQNAIKTADITHSADTSNLPTCMTDARTDLLITHMATNELVPKVSSGAVNLECRLCNRKEFKYFVEHILPPEYRPQSTKNIRKIKKDIFENAARRHPDKACIDQAFHGNKELRLLVYKEIPIPESIINMFSPQPLQCVTQ
jgi:hypothetical protein